MSVITIRGQLGSGAAEIGRAVASILHFEYVDREIIAEVATRLQRAEQDIVKKEMPPNTILGRVEEALSHVYPVDTLGGSIYLPPELIPLDNVGFIEALESVIRELARGGSIVIRGRGSQFILKDHPDSLHVLVVAPLKVRIERIMLALKLDEEAARQEIASYDGSRHEFIKRYYQGELEDPVHYDLVVNTGHFSVDNISLLIVNAFRLKIDSLTKRDKAE